MRISTCAIGVVDAARSAGAAGSSDRLAFGGAPFPFEHAATATALASAIAARPLFIVDWNLRRRLMLEVRPRILRCDRHKGSRRLRVVENRTNAVGADVGRPQTPQAPVVFNEFQNAAELELPVGNQALARIRRNDQH